MKINENIRKSWKIELQGIPEGLGVRLAPSGFPRTPKVWKTELIADILGPKLEDQVEAK